MVKVKNNLIGMVFGMLTVKEQAEDYVKPKSGKHEAQWLCECSCEEHNTVIVLDSNLKKKNGTRSCGCLQDVARKRNKKENKRDLSGEYGIIWSSNTNEEIYFDLENAEKILQHTWSVGKRGYPCARIDQKLIPLHVFLGFKWHDHHNRNKLDNRRNNLVPCTNQENARNVSVGKNNTSGFIGVDLNKRVNKWRARIIVDSQEYSLGLFIDKNDAIRARLRAEKEHFGKFAPQRHLFKEYGIEDEFLENTP